MSKRLVSLVSLLVLVAMALTGCGATAEPTALVQPTAAPTAVVQPTTAPTAAVEPTTAPEPSATTAAAEPQKLTLATTTSTADSGLLDFILPEFEKAYNADVEVIAVGTGQSLELGRNGDADVVLVHSRKGEDAFVADGFARERFDVMYNDYVLVGPTADPAKVKDMKSAKEAFAAVAKAEAAFASRGDTSGTNTKELAIWSSAGITPTKEMVWYQSIGQGMGDTLVFANEQQAYTLADRGTFLSMRKNLPNLTVIVGADNLANNPDKALLNPYGVMAVNPDKYPTLNYDLAMQFIDWILLPETQAMIGGYGVDKFGQPLFYPQITSATAAPAEAGASADVALKITGKVAKEMAWTEEEVRAMPTIDAESTNKDGQTSTYTGVLLTALLALAGPIADATTLVFVADDGYTAEVALADVLTCADCIASFRDKGGFSSVLPGFPGNVQVKGIIELQLK